VTVIDLDKQPKVRSRRRAARPALLTSAQLDGRGNTAKIARMFNRLVLDIESDLGGRNQLSTVERALIQGFAGSAVIVHHLNAKLLVLDEDIDLAAHASAISAMVRIASRLGTQRRAAASPTLGQYLRDKQEPAA
jgi:hypothetical protein